MANGNGDRDDIESARMHGRAVTGKEMTKPRQAALKSLLKRNGNGKSVAFDAAEQELRRRRGGVGGKFIGR